MRGVHMDKNVLNAAVLAALLLSACGGGGATKVAPGQTPTQGRATLQVMGHDSFNMSESVLEEFETANNVDVQILKAGDTGTALNKAILAKADPLADVFYGVDNTFLSRALEEGIFESYDSPLLTVIPDRFKLDPQNRALPVDYGDVCLNYDIEYMQANGTRACWLSKTRPPPPPALLSCSPPSRSTERMVSSTTGEDCWTTACSS
jgi:thiamine transport system substrate-binding protein